MIDIDFGEKNPEWRHGAPAEDWMDEAVDEEEEEEEEQEVVRFLRSLPEEAKKGLMAFLKWMKEEGDEARLEGTAYADNKAVQKFSRNEMKGE